MAEYRLPTVEGRELLIRPAVAAARPQLQLALISTYGNIMEAVTIEAGDALSLVRGAAAVARAANDLHERQRLEESAQAKQRYREALARNRWQTVGPAERKRRGLG